MRITRWLSVVAGACLLVVPAAMTAAVVTSQQAASQEKKAPAATTKAAKAKPAVRHQATGEVVSVSDTSLTITQARTKKELTFNITSDTKKEGEIAQGKRVRVYYTEANGQRNATQIRVLEAHKATTARAKKKTS